MLKKRFLLYAFFVLFFFFPVCVFASGLPHGINGLVLTENDSFSSLGADVKCWISSRPNDVLTAVVGDAGLPDWFAFDVSNFKGEWQPGDILVVEVSKDNFYGRVSLRLNSAGAQQAPDVLLKKRIFSFWFWFVLVLVFAVVLGYFSPRIIAKFRRYKKHKKFLFLFLSFFIFVVIFFLISSRQNSVYASPIPTTDTRVFWVANWWRDGSAAEFINVTGADYVAEWQAETQTSRGATVGHVLLENGSTEETVVGNFMMKFGHPYMVNMPSDTVLVYTGDLPKHVTLELKVTGPGEYSKNMIVIPMDTIIKNAEELCKLPALTNKSEIIWWDKINQKELWSPQCWRIQKYHISIPLNPAQVYAIMINESINLTIP